MLDQASQPLLDVRGVGKRFGGLTALSDVSFTVPHGGIVGVIGPNGAGKSTLFNLITGFLPVTGGEILYEGRSILGMKPNRIARLGVVRTFQKTEVFAELSVLDCVETGLLCSWGERSSWRAFRFGATRRFDVEARDKALAILERTGLADKTDARSTDLSYGEQRLLSVSVALAAEPRLLLLDEPASGLNPRESAQMVAVLRKLVADGLTLCLVEHNMKVVMDISDRVVVIHHGQVIADDVPKCVTRNSDVIAAYLGAGWQNADA